MDPDLPLAVTLHVRDRCLCLQVQRAARALARRFDLALKPVGMTNGQFSLMMALNRPDPPRLTDLAPFLAMDRTTVTAAVRVLEKRGWVQSVADPEDGRIRRLALTKAGQGALKRALPVWQRTHDEVDAGLSGGDVAGLRQGLGRLAEG